MADECLDECNERTSTPLTVSFFDEDGNPVTPDAATYRIDSFGPNSRRGVVVLAATAIPSLSTSVDLDITSDQNQIVNQRNAYEVKRILVEFDYTGIFGSMHGTNEYRHKVINLYGVVDIASASVSPSASASPST